MAETSEMTGFQTPTQDRVVAGVGAGVVVALLGWMLFNGLSVRMQAVIEQPLELLSIKPLAPPPPPPPKPKIVNPKPKASAPASAANLRSKATDVVAPPPVIRLPVPPPIVSAPKPALGVQASNGASNRPGPGQGAGGVGNGTGSGGEGDGDGGGGNSPPEWKRGDLSYSDLPADVRAASAGGMAPVHYALTVQYYVLTNGRVSGCSGTGASAEIVQTICAAIEKRFRYEPSRLPSGEPVRSIVEDTYSWTLDRESGTGRIRHEGDR